MKAVPLKRLSKFYSEKDFETDIDMAREYLNEDMATTFILYKVDRNRSVIDDLYGESSFTDVRFLPPIEIAGILNLTVPENKSYDSSGGTVRYLEYGNLIIEMIEQELEDYGVDIDYGDYVAIQETEYEFAYFQVTNDGRVNSDNVHTMRGYKKAFRTITCAPVDPQEFNG